MFENMKLMRKIALIFISVTLISSICYQLMGKKVVEYASIGETERGPGRLNGAINRIDGEVNKITSQAREFGEYFTIAKKINEKNGENSSEQYINLNAKLGKADVPNMFAVDKDFNLTSIFKNTNINLDGEDIKFILEESKKLIESDSYSKRGFFGGIIATENMPYILAVKRIGDYGDSNIGYNIAINPIDEEYITVLKDITQRTISFVNEEDVSDLIKDMEEIHLYNTVFYCNRSDQTIDFYTEFETLGDGTKYYIKLEDDRSVRKIAETNINKLIFYVILITIATNLFVYYLIKKNVLNRIININKAVNKVNEGNDLALTIEDDSKGDEISILTNDINGMFSRLKDYSDNLEYVGEHDLVTSLANRNKIMKQIVELKYNNKEFALFFIDLDNFKRFNDTLGHNEGDKLLRIVAQKLIAYCEKHNLQVARIGGDEFIIVREGTNDEKIIKKIASEVLKDISTNLEVHNCIYEVKASIGISFYPQHSESDVTLLQYSDIAMYNCKNNGGDSFSIFNESMLEQINIEGKITSGLENKEFVVYYQPIFEADSEKIAGAEALIRWITNEGIISPDKFIPAAKKSGKIVDIDNFVLSEAIKTCKEQLENGREDFYISINASKRFLKQKNVISLITNKLDEAAVPYKMLKIEITEDEIIDDFDYTIGLLNEIRSLGIKVSLDDFGVGYSSFNHIKILPVDVIKLDRSLLQGIDYNIKDKAIVETIISLCHNIKLRVVCEGVETKEQVDILKSLKCDNIQGYYYSRPLPKSEFDELTNK